jgi:hypothetical protein
MFQRNRAVWIADNHKAHRIGPLIADRSNDAAVILRLAGTALSFAITAAIQNKESVAEAPASLASLSVWPP